MHGELSDLFMHNVSNLDLLYSFVAGLSIQGNNLQGSLETLCDERDDHRVQFESYFTSMVEADCLGEPREAICLCCMCF